MRSGPSGAGDHSPAARPGNVPAPASGSSTTATPAASRRHLREQGAGSGGGAGAGPAVGRPLHFRRMGPDGRCACVNPAATSAPCPASPPPSPSRKLSEPCSSAGTHALCSRGPLAYLPRPPPIKSLNALAQCPILSRLQRMGRGKACVIPAGKEPVRRIEAKLIEERLCMRADDSLLGFNNNAPGRALCYRPELSTSSCQHRVDSWVL